MESGRHNAVPAMETGMRVASSPPRTAADAHMGTRDLQAILRDTQATPSPCDPQEIAGILWKIRHSVEKGRGQLANYLIFTVFGVYLTRCP